MKPSRTNYMAAGIRVTVAILTGLAIQTSITPARAQGTAPAAAQGTAPADKTLLDPNDSIVLLLDHQTGLFQTVKDIPVAELRANTVVLAKIATLGKAPVITTASEPNGPNGPLMPELKTAAPNATYVPRKGEVSAWDNADFRRTVQASGKRTLIMAGVWTSVCVAFPALQAKAEGYKVYAVIDASGDMSDIAARATMDRMTQAGIILVTTNVVLCEFQRTWARPDAASWGALYNELVPNYRAVSESYQTAQTAARLPQK
jgi:nicotinamidase-related amidase